MSISNLFTPNSYNLYCQSLTTNNMNIETLTTDELTTTDVNCQTLTLSNKRTVPFKFYFIDGFNNYESVPSGIFEMTLISLSNFIIIDFPDVDLTLSESIYTLIIANPGIPPSGPGKLSLEENITHSYLFNYLFDVSGNRVQGCLSIPEGLDEAFTITKFDFSQFTGTIDFFGNSFVVLSS